jgi:hypothetical protein
MTTAVQLLSISVTLLLGLAGFMLARSISKEVRLKLAERRLAAYERLWALTRGVNPYCEPLDAHGRGLSVRDAAGAFRDAAPPLIRAASHGLHDVLMYVPSAVSRITWMFAARRPVCVRSARSR